MIVFALALAVSLVATPVVVWMARRWGLIDVPNRRSSHASPVPRGGGVSVALATMVGIAVAGEWPPEIVALVVGSVVLALLGLLDDRVSLPAMPRLVVQLAVPGSLAFVVADRSSAGLVIAAALAAVLVAGYVNAFNFMDGINGIAGTQALVAGAFLAGVAREVGADALGAASVAVCGAALGFLPFNAPRARIFLGDAGSYFLGFWLAGIALLMVDIGVSPLVVLGPFLLYLADTTTVLVRRARRGERLTEAHREHAYQRLVRRGFAHVAVSALAAAVSACCAVAMYLVVDARGAVQAVAAAGCLALVAVFVALPDLLPARRSDRRLASS